MVVEQPDPVRLILAMPGAPPMLLNKLFQALLQVNDIVHFHRGHFHGNQDGLHMPLPVRYYGIMRGTVVELRQKIIFFNACSGLAVAGNDHAGSVGRQGFDSQFHPGQGI